MRRRGAGDLNERAFVVRYAARDRAIRQLNAVRRVLSLNRAVVRDAAL
jgi:hypothetical protein